jgi:hypothetical protein
MKGREQQAERALRRIRGAKVDESAIHKEIDDINEANALEKAMKKGITLFDLFRGVNRVHASSNKADIREERYFVLLAAFSKQRQAPLFSSTTPPTFS